MRITLAPLAGMLSLSLITSTAFATDPAIDYQARKLPDGSYQMDIMQSDGTKVMQNQRPDGSSTIISTETDGSQTIVTTHADGSVETKTIPKK